jgi:hypothetical protein
MSIGVTYWDFGSEGKWTKCAWCEVSPYPHVYAYFWHWDQMAYPYENHWVAWLFKSGKWGPLKRFYIVDRVWHHLIHFDSLILSIYDAVFIISMIHDHFYFINEVQKIIMKYLTLQWRNIISIGFFLMWL